MSLDLLITPDISLETLGRALAAVPIDRPSLVALVVPLHEAQALALQLRDGDGQPAGVDLSAYASVLSRGGWPVGLAHQSPDCDRWETWSGGERTLVLGCEDALFLPFDDEGFPDVQVAPVRAADGPPEGWRRWRSCHDLGMTALHSCRFRLVLWSVRRAIRGEGDARALVLAEDGEILSPPQEVSWPGHFAR